MNLQLTRVGRSFVLATAAATFAVIFAARLAIDDATEPILFLFVIPVGLLASEFGLRGGFVGASIATVLVVLWDVIAEPPISVFGYATRFAIFYLSGLSVGFLTATRAETEAESNRWFEQSADLNCVVDLNGRFVRVNRAWSTTLGYPARSLLGTEFISFVHPDDVKATAELAARVSNEQETSVNFENRYRRMDGSYVWLRWTSTTDFERQLIYATARDVTSTRDMHDQLISLSLTDPLTGLANRRAFESEAASQIDFVRRYGSGGALLLIDIDRFKEINDTHGHEAGDDALIYVGRVLTDRCRSTDLVARLGGDEFVALLPESTAESATRIVTELQSRLASFESKRFDISTSIGIAVFSASDDVTVSALVSKADAAMYEAKRAGGGQFHMVDVTDTERLTTSR